jgi:hypothetical protein
VGEDADEGTLLDEAIRALSRALAAGNERAGYLRERADFVEVTAEKRRLNRSAQAQEIANGWMEDELRRLEGERRALRSG